MRLRHALASAGLGAALLAGVVTAPANAETARAAASDCNWVPNEWDQGSPGARTTADAVAHDGPYGKCPGYSIGARWVTPNCVYYNEPYHNKWYYTDWGWIYSKYLSFPYGAPTRTCTP
ncbi:hypothetical protein [Streptomyces sp. HC307]|uniref:hypothetical protein n=1 Tax=Streptomyces flavusporus TaxID=3385496 RepID=UPI00391748B7